MDGTIGKKNKRGTNDLAEGHRSRTKQFQKVRMFSLENLRIFRRSQDFHWRLPYLSFLWRPPEFHWRLPDFIRGPQISLEALGFHWSPQIFIRDPKDFQWGLKTKSGDLKILQ